MCLQHRAYTPAIFWDVAHWCSYVHRYSLCPACKYAVHVSSCVRPICRAGCLCVLTCVWLCTGACSTYAQCVLIRACRCGVLVASLVHLLLLALYCHPQHRWLRSKAGRMSADLTSYSEVLTHSRMRSQAWHSVRCGHCSWLHDCLSNISNRAHADLVLSQLLHQERLSCLLAVLIVTRAYPVYDICTKPTSAICPNNRCPRCPLFHLSVICLGRHTALLKLLHTG